MRFIARNSPLSSDAPTFNEAHVRRLTDGWDYSGHTRRSPSGAVIFMGPGLWTPAGVDDGIGGTSLAANAEGERLLRDAGVLPARGGAREGAGRPPKPADDKSSERVEVRLTPAQLAQLDRDRGAESRSAYLARRADLTGE